MKTYTSPVAFALLGALLLSCSAGKQSATYLEQRSEQTASAKELTANVYTGVTSDPVLNEVIGIVRNRYVHTYTYDPNTDTTVDAVLSRLDPFSFYYTAGSDNAVWYRTESWYLGLKVSVARDTPSIICIAVGSNFDGKGLLPGDRILAVNDRKVISPHFSTFETGAHAFVTVISSGIDSQNIRLEIFRPLTQETFITSASGYLDPQYKVVYGTMLTESTAYMTIFEFREGIFSEVVRTLNELSLRGMKNLVLDLQWNPGGYVNEANEILSLFFDESSRLVAFVSNGKTARGRTKMSVRHGRYAKLPMVIVVNENTASASELIAGVMQDKDRALVIGATTFGKGMVVTPYLLHSESASLHLATDMVILPTGRTIQLPYTGRTVSKAPFRCDTFLDNSDHSFEGRVLGTKNTKFYTSKNRPVYEHSAVVPDYFVPLFMNVYTDAIAASDQFDPDEFIGEMSTYQRLFVTYTTPTEFYTKLLTTPEGKELKARITASPEYGIAYRYGVDYDEIVRQMAFSLSHKLFGIYSLTKEALMDRDRIAFAVSLLEPKKDVVKTKTKKSGSAKKRKMKG